MNPLLAGRVAAAVDRHLMVDVDVRAPGGEWRTVRGLERKASVPQRPDGLVTQLLTDSDAVHLLGSDWPEGARPAAKWQVRFADGRVRTFTEPLRAVDSAGQFIGGPVT